MNCSVQFVIFGGMTTRYAHRAYYPDQDDSEKPSKENQLSDPSGKSNVEQNKEQTGQEPT